MRKTSKGLQHFLKKYSDRIVFIEKEYDGMLYGELKPEWMNDNDGQAIYESNLKAFESKLRIATKR